ncbi:hypothetical protein D3C72_931130 [compost metagenome]
MAAFFLDHGLKCLDQLGREEAGILGRGKQPERGKAVDALAVAGHQPAPFGVGGRQVLGFRCQRDAIRLHQLGQHHLVARLLVGIHLQRAAQQRVAHGAGVAVHADGRTALGLHGDVPDRQRGHAAQRIGRQHRPVDHGRFVGVVGLEQHVAEHAQMLGRADAEPVRQGIGPVAHGVVGLLHRRAGDGRRHGGGARFSAGGGRRARRTGGVGRGGWQVRDAAIGFESSFHWRSGQGMRRPLYLAPVNIAGQGGLIF